MRVFLIAATMALASAACQTSENTEMAEAEPDTRQGEQFSQICFSSQIRNWRENDRNSITEEQGRNVEFKINLIGGCDPESAFTSIGLVSRGASSCLSSGDKLVTDSRFDFGSCSINRIYKWNEDAAEESEESDES